MAVTTKRIDESTAIDGVQVEYQASLSASDANTGQFAFKTDGLPYAINAAGTEYDLSGGGGSHASDHLTGGSDEIDGDKLDIDFTPSNYTPATTPSEADNVDNLTAHLYGIDQALASSSITIAHNPGTYYVPSNITSTSSSWADIDGTNIKETVVVASGDIVEVTFHLPSVWQTTGVDLDLRIVADDGADTLDDNSYEVTVSTTEERSVLLIALFTGLPADTYDFKPQWQKPTGGGSMIVDADTAVTWNVRVTS